MLKRYMLCNIVHGCNYVAIHKLATYIVYERQGRSQPPTDGGA